MQSGGVGKASEGQVGEGREAGTGAGTGGGDTCTGGMGAGSDAGHEHSFLHQPSPPDIVVPSQ